MNLSIFISKTGIIQTTVVTRNDGMNASGLPKSFGFDKIDHTQAFRMGGMLGDALMPYYLFPYFRVNASKVVVAKHPAMRLQSCLWERHPVC